MELNPPPRYDDVYFKAMAAIDKDERMTTGEQDVWSLNSEDKLRRNGEAFFSDIIHELNRLERENRQMRDLITTHEAPPLPKTGLVLVQHKFNGYDAGIHAKGVPCPVCDALESKETTT